MWKCGWLRNNQVYKHELMAKTHTHQTSEYVLRCVPDVGARVAEEQRAEIIAQRMAHKNASLKQLGNFFLDNWELTGWSMQ